MADTATPTTGIELILPENQTPGWGTKQEANLIKIDTMLGTTLAIDVDPNGSVAGYKNQFISDANTLPIIWQCIVQGDAANAEWEQVGVLVKPQIITQRDVWTAPQVSKWVSETPVAGTIVLDSADDFITVTIGAAFEIPLPTPGAPFTTTDGQIIVLEINQHPTIKYAVTSAAGISWPGGQDPPAPEIATFGLYTLVKRNGTDIWAGNYALY